MLKANRKNLIAACFMLSVMVFMTAGGTSEYQNWYRQSHWRAPQDAAGESTTVLGWKHSPVLISPQNNWGDPVYYQLLYDYTIDLTSYFQDYNALPDHIPFPGAVGQDEEIWRTSLRSEEWRFLLAEWVENHLVPSSDPRILEWDYFVLWVEPGPPQHTMLTVKKGYRWDGPSINWPEPLGSGRLAAKPSALMRASMVHDVVYDFMRLGFLDHDTATPVLPVPEPNEMSGWFNRAVADSLFYMLAVQDGYYPDKALSDFITIRNWGHTRTWPGEPLTFPSWKIHALADAGEDQEFNCAPPTGIDVNLDGSQSKFAVSWIWITDDTVVTGERSTVHLEPGIHTVTLFVDDGNDGADGPFNDSDEVIITVNGDSEPPVITGITEPLILWPPNHKYATFTPADFVLSVSDNCSDLSLDDLVVSRVTSDEPENARGVGDGNTRNDMWISCDGKSVMLRCERQGGGNGRVYTIYIEAVDDSGNAATESFQVHVPHSSGGTAIDDGPAYSVHEYSCKPAEVKPVHRFWSRTHQAHFFTIDEVEKNIITADKEESVWQYEGIKFYVYGAGKKPASARPVYRFWSNANQVHFWTISESEKDNIIANYPESVWKYEGIVFYAYEQGDEPAGTAPVYRFWSPVLEAHFYTISEDDKNKVIDNYPHVWAYEGVVWYAYE